MLKKDITYMDFDDQLQTDEIYFHLSAGELIDMEVQEDGGLSAKLQAILSAEDTKSMLRIFKDVMLSAYGVRSEDGKRFVKTDETRIEFEQSLAYDALFAELVTDENALVEFVKGLLPAELMKRLLEKVNEPKAVEPKMEEVPWANREPTTKELMGMTNAQMVDVYKRKNQVQN